MTEEIYNKATNLRSLIEKDKKAHSALILVIMECVFTL